VTVPANFDVTKSSDKYALVDLSTSPPSLVNRTVLLKREIATFLSLPANQEKRFRILNFKCGVELSCSTAGTFEKIGVFDHVSPLELLSLVSP
jgi:hypothetical protein